MARRPSLKVPKPRAVSTGLFGAKKGGGLFSPRDYTKQAQKSIDNFGLFDFGNTGLAETGPLSVKPHKRKMKL